jgi:hypothetical protein
MINDNKRGADGGIVEGETEVLGDSLSKCGFVHHKPHKT